NGGAPSPAAAAQATAAATGGRVATSARPSVDSAAASHSTGGCRQRSVHRAATGWPTATPAVYAPTSTPATAMDIVPRANNSSAGGAQPGGSLPPRLAASTRPACGLARTARRPAGAAGDAVTAPRSRRAGYGRTDRWAWAGAPGGWRGGRGQARYRAAGH